MDKAYRHCQSCGMPLDKDREGGGSEADGSRSPKYCSFCYRQGEFVDPELTLAQMRQRVRAISKKIAIKSGRPAPVAGAIALYNGWRLSALERWRNSS